jgi:hypothetical protein
MPDTTPLRIGDAILVDDAQRDLDAARARYRKEYDRGYFLSERGNDVAAGRILHAASEALYRAELRYEAARAKP